MIGQLWEPCFCGNEPVCSQCFKCEKHCTCSEHEIDLDYEINKRRCFKLLREINGFFEHAQKPKGMFELEGKKREDPLDPQNIYGGGRWWVIGKRWIWKIRNNGMDGDDWSQNNILTAGAGAIGVRVKYTTALAKKIEKYIKVAKKIAL